MATAHSLWVTIFWSILDACCTSEHPFFSRFEAEKGLRVIHACVVYTPFYSEQVLENIIKRAFGDLNNVFQEEFNKILSQQSTNVRFV